MTSTCTDLDLPTTRNAIKQILEHTIEGIVIIGDDKIVEYVNDRVCDIIGLPRDEILGQSFQRFVHPDSSDLVENRYTSRLDGETIHPTYDVKVLRNNDEPRNLRVRTTVLTSVENKLKILVQILDVTEEIRTQCHLFDYVMKYSTLLETMSDGLGVIDDEGVLTHANAALCMMLEYTEKELVGKTTADIMHGFTLDVVFDKIKERIAGKTSRYETSLIHKSGRLIPTMVSASPLFSEEGEYKGSFAIFTDITKQKAIEKDLQTARDRSLLYLDLMSHDLRNHLQEIQVAAGLMQFEVDNDSIPDLVDRLLDRALNETLMAAITLFDDVEFRMSIHVSDARVRADEYLEMLLSDLLSNSCEHSTKDGKQVWISLTEGKTAYELEVSDNRPNLFENLKNGQLGTSHRFRGLRLHLVHYIIVKYGGTLEILNRVQDEPSQGTKVKLTFPKM